MEQPLAGGRQKNPVKSKESVEQPLAGGRQKNPVKLVYKGHSRESENVDFMSRCP